MFQTWYWLYNTAHHIFFIRYFLFEIPLKNQHVFCSSSISSAFCPQQTNFLNFTCIVINDHRHLCWQTNVHHLNFIFYSFHCKYSWFLSCSDCFFSLVLSCLVLSCVRLFVVRVLKQQTTANAKAVFVCIIFYCVGLFEVLKHWSMCVNVRSVLAAWFKMQLKKRCVSLHPQLAGIVLL